MEIDDLPRALIAELPSGIGTATAASLTAANLEVSVAAAVTGPKIESAIDQLLVSTGTPDILVLGVLGSGSPALFTELEPAGWWTEVEYRLSVTFGWVKAVAAAMSRRPRARIVFVVDDSGVSGAFAASVESTISSATIAMAKSLARELGPVGIAVNAVAVAAGPGSATELVAQSQPVAETIAFLADVRLPALTGQIIACNGGRTRTRI